jgi:tetratricopeptide (TPR) repeat protein
LNVIFNTVYNTSKNIKMKQLFFFSGFFLLGITVLGQQPEKIYSITRLQKNHAYYSEQTALWEKEIQKSPKDTEAWFNFYTAARMTNMFASEGGARLNIDAIAEDLKAKIPNTFEYHYVSYAQGNRSKEAFEHLQKAYSIDPERYETWDSFITKAEMEGDTKAMKPYFEKWYRHELYSPGITSWNYNVLIGLDANAIILTFGDNDTYPLWFLQQVKNIRKDVKVLNTSLLIDLSYQKRIFKELGIPTFDKTLQEMGSYQSYRDAMMEHILKNTDRPGYIGISAPSSFRNQHDSQLFLIGLAFKYSNQEFDHVAVIRKNYEQLFLKDYLNTNLTNDFSQSVVDYMDQQYIPCLSVLYKHYLLSGEEQKAAEVKNLLVQIGEKNQMQADIQGFLAKFNH